MKLIISFLFFIFYSLIFTSTLYYEKDGALFKYDISSKQDSLFLKKNGYTFWGVKSSKKYTVFQAASIKNINGEKVELNDIYVIDNNLNKLKTIIGDEFTNEESAIIIDSFVYYLSDKTGRKELYKYNIENNNFNKITDLKWSLLYPVFDLKNNLIFVQSYNYDLSKWEIYSFDIKKNYFKKQNFGQDDLEYISVAPNGQMYAFELYEKDKSFIAVYNIKKNQLKKISKTGNEIYPKFSPDSSKITWISGGNLSVLQLNKNQLLEIPAEKTGYITSYCWIDNNSIAFSNNSVIKLLDITSLTTKFITYGSSPSFMP